MQFSTVHVDGMMNSNILVKSELINLCATKKFADIFKEAQKMSDDLGFKYINFLRKKLQDDIKVVDLQNSRTAMLKTTLTLHI